MKDYKAPKIVFIDLRSEENIATNSVTVCELRDGYCPEPYWFGNVGSL